jgi:uncharacterized protein (DUF488 family)
MSTPIHLFTIGFTEKTAAFFFGLLKDNQVGVLVDIRLSPDSQLSGFAKKRDLPYFLRHLADCDYVYQETMAPTKTLLETYRQDKSWEDYEIKFKALLEERDLINHLDRTWWQNHRACLLCSEHLPDYCHRRLVAEYIQHHWTETQIHHLIK